MPKEPLTYIDFSDRAGRLYARIPKSLKEALKHSSKKSGRNLNAELMVRLAHSLENHEFIECVPNGLGE